MPAEETNMQEQAKSGATAAERLIAYQQMLTARLEAHAARHGLVLFNYQWLTPQQARAQWRRRQFQHLWITMEILALCAGLLALGGLLGITLLSLVG